MFRFFLTPEAELPKDVGFALYGKWHLLFLAGIAGLTVFMLCSLRRKQAEAQNRVLRGLSVSMVILEICKDFLLALIGAFSTSYLPLHLCSIAMFVCLYYAFHPNSQGAGQLLYSVCFPGALCALLFPDWTAFPILHFQSLHSFLYHLLLVEVSLSPVAWGRIRPGIREIPRSLVFLVVVAVPVYIMNHIMHTNYMFLQIPSKGSPLELFAAIPGKWGYLLGYLLLVLAILVFLNAPFSLVSRHSMKIKKEK